MVQSSLGTAKRSWPIVKFGDMAQNVAVRVDPAETDAEVYVGLEHLDPECLQIRRWGTPEDVIGQKLAFKKGDIIFGRRRAYQRKLAVADFDGICSAHAMVVRAKPKVVLPEFLPFLMQSDLFMNRAVAISVGSLSPTINWKTLKVQEFPLPPLKEQKRLAELLWAAEESLRAFTSVESQLRRTWRVALAQAMHDGLGAESRGLTKTAANGRWKIKRVREAGDVQLGRQRAPKYQSGRWTHPYLRVANVFDGYFDFSDVLSMDFDESDYRTYHLQPGDILLNEGQSRELVGRCALYGGQIDGCCFQNTLVRFRAGDGLLPEFAFAYFRYLFYRGTYAAIATQTTSIAHLGSDNFGKLYMPVPPIQEQRAIVTRLQEVGAATASCTTHVGIFRQVKELLLRLTTEGKSHE